MGLDESKMVSFVPSNLLTGAHLMAVVSSYFIDLEQMGYDVDYINWTRRPWRDFIFGIWNLSRDGRDISD